MFLLLMSGSGLVPSSLQRLLRLKECKGTCVNACVVPSILTIKYFPKYSDSCKWQSEQMLVFWCGRLPPAGNHSGYQQRHARCKNYKQSVDFTSTSLTNHWQKAGPIHSLAWTPQSIHTAFFWGRRLFPSWRDTSVVSFRVGQECVYLSVYVPSLLPEAHKVVFLHTTSQ